MHATGRSKYRKQYSDTNVVKAKSGPRSESSILFRRFPGSDTDRQQPDTQYPSDTDPDRIQTSAILGSVEHEVPSGLVYGSMTDLASV